jgi:hypothetical protein
MYPFPTTLWDSCVWTWSGSCTFLVILIGVLIYFARRCAVSGIAGFLWAIVTCTLMFALLLASPWNMFRGGTLWTPTLLLIAVVVAIAGHAWQQRVAWKNGEPARVGALAGWCFLILLYGVIRPPETSASPESARRTQCKNNLKQLGLSLHTYHDVFSSFPAAAGTKPPVSWRVLLSPYLDKNNILSRYDVDAEWDSETNWPLQAERRPMFECPSRPISVDDQQRFLTSYLAIAGPGTVFDGAEGKTIRDIRDGTTNTLMIAEACGTNVIWTDPRDQLVDQVPLSINAPGSAPGQSPGLMSSYHLGGAQALLADGSVRFVSQHIDPVVLKSLTTRAGGENIGEW